MVDKRHQAVVSVPVYTDEQSIQSDAGRKAKRHVQQVVELKDYQMRLPLQNVDENGKLKEVEDMVDLPFLHEVREGEKECNLQDDEANELNGADRQVTGTHIHFFLSHYLYTIIRLPFYTISKLVTFEANRIQGRETLLLL
jgi:hypothetical protein